jgi:hypothetical protein
MECQKIQGKKIIYKAKNADSIELRSGIFYIEQRINYLSEELTLISNSE